MESGKVCAHHVAGTVLKVFIMISSSGRHIRNFVLGLIVILAAGSPVALVDTDGDDETPVVAIELAVTMPGRQAVHLPDTQVLGRREPVVLFHRESIAGSREASTQQHAELAIPLVVPLRT